MPLGALVPEHASRDALDRDLDRNGLEDPVDVAARIEELDGAPELLSCAQSLWRDNP